MTFYLGSKSRQELSGVHPDLVRNAGHCLGVRLRWGGHWDELTGTTLPPEALVDDYVEQRRRARRRANIDGPHFELIL